MCALARLEAWTRQDGLVPQYTLMKASCAGPETEEAAWLDWMARYTEYSVILPHVTAGASQVS